MTLELLLAEFDSLIQTPADVEKLNATILQWAVQGRLVPQCEDDEPVQELVKKIDADRENRIKARQIRRQNDLPEVEPEEQLFTIPKNWKWIRLGEIGDWGAGATPSRRKPEYYDGTIPWLKTGELNDGYIGGAEEHVTELALNETSLRLCKPGDVLIAMYGATIGKLGILEIEATTNQACCACTPFEGVFNRFLFMHLFAMRTHFREQGAGGAQPNISRTKIIATPFPLPPLAEQKRIVARVDELLGQTAVLTQQLASVHEQRRGVHTAVLHQLTQATTKTSEVSSERSSPTSEVSTLAAHFDRFYVDADTVAELKQAILQLAVQGRLVPQDERDEDAAVLLERIQEEKKRLIKQGEIPKSRNSTTFSENQILYTIPASWEWCNINDISYKVTDGEHSTPIRSEEGYFLLSARNVTNEGIDLSNVDFVEQEEFDRIRKRCDPDKGDVLISCSGSVGRIAIVDEDYKYVMVRSAALVKHDHVNVKSEYLAFALRSPILQEQIESKSKKSAQANLFLGAIKSLLIPLPPLNEQKRIVAKVDELFALCDQLAGQLTTTAATRTQLLEAVLAQA